MSDPLPEDPFGPASDLRARADPPAAGADTFRVPRDLIARLEAGLGLSDDTGRPLQEWAIGALASRTALARSLGDDPAEATRRLAALFVLPVDTSTSALVTILVDAHGLTRVVTALVAPLPVAPLFRREADPTAPAMTRFFDRLALVHPDRSPGPPRDRTSWANALRPHITRADEAERRRCRAIVAAARPALTLPVRAALSRAFADPAWAEEDAQAHLAQTTRGSSGELPATWLMPYVEDEATFTALLSRHLQNVSMHGSAVAEIAVRPPRERAAARVAAVLAEAAARKHIAYVRDVAGVAAAFADEAAASGIAAAALEAPDVAKTFFTRHPEWRGHLEAKTKGRGKKPAAYRELLAEMDRQAHARATAEANLPPPASIELPACIAHPPWESPPAPWPARDVTPIVDRAREHVLEGKEIAQFRRTFEEGASRRPPASDVLDASILGGRGVINIDQFFQLQREAALASVERLGSFSLGAALGRFGADAIPAVARVMSAKPLKGHASLLPFLRTPRVALVAVKFHQDYDWLTHDPELAALGLVPPLFARPLEGRWAAELGLLFLVRRGHAKSVLAAADAYGVEVGAEVRRILDRDPRSRIPPQRPAIHARFRDGSLPLLETARGPLPPTSNAIVGSLLAISLPWLPHPGIDELRQVTTEASRDALAWAIFDKTHNLEALAFLGADDSARRLDQRLSARTTQLGRAELRQALAVLGRIGTPLARTLYFKHLLLSPWSDRSEWLAAGFAEMARNAGHPPAAFACRMFPDLGFSPNDPPMTLDYGARRFVVRIDDHLAPVVHPREADGRLGEPLAKLPRATKKDEPAKVARASAALQALILDLDDVRETILLWLERAMASEEDWDHASFAALAGHPLVGRIARRIVWAARSPAGGLRAFRITEDGTLADDTDGHLDLAPDERARVAHPAGLSAESLRRFREIFGDYAIIQPFPQLEREIHAFTDGERAATSIPRFDGRRVASARRSGLYGGRGWRESKRGVMERPFGDRIVELEIAGQSVHAHGETAADRLGTLSIRGPGGERATFGDLSPVAASEVLRDLETLPVA